MQKTVPHSSSGIGLPLFLRWSTKDTGEMDHAHFFPTTVDLNDSYTWYYLKQIFRLKEYVSSVKIMARLSSH